MSKYIISSWVPILRLTYFISYLTLVCTLVPSIIITLYSFGMSIRVMFAFLASPRDMKFCMHPEFIKALVLKFPSCTGTYNSWFIELVVPLLLVAMVAFPANLKESTPSNCCSPSDSSSLKDWLYRSFSTCPVLGTAIPSENSKLVIVCESAPSGVTLPNSDSFSLVGGFSSPPESSPSNVKSIRI